MIQEAPAKMLAVMTKQLRVPDNNLAVYHDSVTAFMVAGSGTLATTPVAAFLTYGPDAEVRRDLVLSKLAGFADLLEVLDSNSAGDARAQEG
jgi:hypothetical protein